MNGGWIQLAGPLSRIADFKQIETTLFGSALQQVRYPPTRVAYTAALARSRMFMLPGAVYVDPEFSWKYEIGPAGTTFVSGNALGAEYNGTLWIGSRAAFRTVGGNGGSLYRLRLTPDRLSRRHQRRSAPGGPGRGQSFRARSSTARKARRCRSARASASRPTSSKGPTATCTSCPSPTTSSTGSAAPLSLP